MVFGEGICEKERKRNKNCSFHGFYCADFFVLLMPLCSSSEAAFKIFIADCCFGVARKISAFDSSAVTDLTNYTSHPTKDCKQRLPVGWEMRWWIRRAFRLISWSRRNWQCNTWRYIRNCNCSDWMHIPPRVIHKLLRFMCRISSKLSVICALSCPNLFHSVCCVFEHTNYEYFSRWCADQHGKEFNLLVMAWRLRRF